MLFFFKFVIGGFVVVIFFVGLFMSLVVQNCIDIVCLDVLELVVYGFYGVGCMMLDFINLDEFDIVWIVVGEMLECYDCFLIVEVFYLLECYKIFVLMIVILCDLV